MCIYLSLVTIHRQGGHWNYYRDIFAAADNMSDSAQSSTQSKGNFCINTDTWVQGFHSFHSSMLQLYTLNYYTSLSNIGYTSAVVPGFRYSQTKDKNMVNKLKNNQQQKNLKSWLMGMTGTFPSWERYSLVPELYSVRRTYEPNSTPQTLNLFWKQNEMRTENKKKGERQY